MCFFINLNCAGQAPSFFVYYFTKFVFSYSVHKDDLIVVNVNTSVKKLSMNLNKFLKN